MSLLFLNYGVTWFSSGLIVVRCQSEIEADVEDVEDVEGSELGIVREDVQDFVGGSFKPAPGVETICFFPKNSAKRKNSVMLYDLRVMCFFFYFISNW